MNIPGAGNGVVVWQRMPLVFAMMDDVNAAEQPVGTKARLVTGDKVSISVGAAAAGKVVNFRGEDLAAQAPVGQDSAPLFGAPVLQAEMATISQPLHTGLTAVDALTPIGRGQNMLVISDPALGKLDLALDALANHVAHGSPAMYVSTKGDHEAVSKRLEEMGVLAGTVVVTSKTISPFELTGL